MRSTDAIKEDQYFFVDETHEHGLEGLSAVCIAEIDDVAGASQAIRNRAASILVDPYYTNIPSVHESLARDGFHYSQDVIDVRKAFTTVLHDIAFEAYLAFSEKTPIDSEFRWYDDLLAEILPNRLARYRHLQCRVIVEHHGQKRLRQSQLQQKVAELTHQLELRYGTPFVKHPSIELCAKSELCLAIPDYVVGLFRDYWLKGKANHGSVEFRLFQEVWPRLRVATNLDNHVRYWRNHPLPGIRIG